MQGADGAHLECAISAKAKPISELITRTLCESWGFPGDGGDEAALCSPSAAAGAGGAGGLGWPPKELSCPPWGQRACKSPRLTHSELSDIIEVVSVPSPVVFLAVSREAYSWGGFKVPSSVCSPQDSCGSDTENMNIPEGRASFAFVSLPSKIGRERVAAPKLPGLIVNFNWA